jgi:hypothetical protein
MNILDKMDEQLDKKPVSTVAAVPAKEQVLVFDNIDDFDD